MLTLTHALTVSALLSLAAAQLSISSACTTAITSIAISADSNACLVPTPLLSIITSPNASIVAPIDTWLKGLCAAPACSNTTLAAIVGNVTTGCSAELAGFGLTASATDASAITTLVQSYYPVVRQAVCLKDGNTNCITQTLNNFEAVLGPLSIQNIIALSAGTSMPNIPPNITCTNCIKAIYNEVNTGIPGLLGSTSGIQSTCGASFTDGTTPSGISESASDAVATTGNGNTTKGNGASQLSLGALSGAGVIAAFALLMGGA